MSAWDMDFVDAEVEGYIRFEADGLGEFHFGYVHCDIDYDITKRDGLPSLSSRSKALMRWTGQRAGG